MEVVRLAGKDETCEEAPRPASEAPIKDTAKFSWTTNPPLTLTECTPALGAR